MENSLIKNRFEKGIRFFLVLFTSVTIIGLFIDVLLGQNETKIFDTVNIIEIGLNIVVLTGFILNKIEVRKSYCIVAYTLLLNSFISALVNIDQPMGLEFFLRDSIFIIIIVVLNAFILGKNHFAVLVAIYLVFLIGYTFISQQPFLLKNFIIITFVIVIVSYLLYLIKTVLDSTIIESERLFTLLKKGNQEFEKQNVVLKEQTDELTKLNKILESKSEMLNAQKEDLQKVNLTKDKLFSIVSHDLKDLVGAIYGSSMYLEEKFNDMEDSKKYQFVAIINESTQKLSDLLENLLYWSRTQSNKINMTKDALHLYKVVNKVIEPNKKRLSDKNLSFINDIPKESVTEGDAQLLFIIFHNLISNAIKFSLPGGTIRVAITENHDFQLIEIIDDGVGMEIEKYNTIFALKPGENQAGTSGEKGTGLGLTLCKEFVDMHDGEIGAKPNSNKGSVFWFRLPKSTSSAN